MNAHRIVATATIALGLLAIAIPDAQSAEPQRKRMVIKAKKAKKAKLPPIDRDARHAEEKKFAACLNDSPFGACIASCYQECRK